MIRRISIAACFVAGATIAGCTSQVHQGSMYGQLLLPEPLLAFSNTMVRADNTMANDSSIPIPAFRASRAVTPIGWNIAYTKEEIAVAPIYWERGEDWNDVLDRWGKTNRVNVMIDGFNKRIVASPEQPRREAGVVWIHSASVLHQELYNPDERFKEAEQYSRRLLQQYMGDRNIDYMSLNEVQAQLYTLMQLAHNQAPDPMRLGPYKSREQVVSEEAERLAEVQSREQEAEREYLEKEIDQYSMRGGIKIHSNGRASFEMRKGDLKPQVGQLLADAGYVSSVERVYWQAGAEIQWPHDSVVTELSLNRLVGSILGGYQLSVRFTGNGLAIINYASQTEV